MLSFTCDNANQLPHSNEFLDQVIGMRLLLGTYQRRPEAEDFRSRMHELEVEYLTGTGIVEIESQLRSACDISKLGTSREATEEILSTQQIMLRVPGILIGIVWLIKGFRTIMENAQNPNVQDANYTRNTYILRYKEEFSQKPLGGIWKPRYVKYLFSPRLIKKTWLTLKIMMTRNICVTKLGRISRSPGF